MVAVRLIVEVERLALLLPVRVKKRRVQIEKHHLWRGEGIRRSAQRPENPGQLRQRALVHPVVEAGQRRLRRQRGLVEDRRENRVVRQLVGAVVRKIRGQYLVEHLKQVVIVLVVPELGFVVCLKHFAYQLVQPNLGNEFLYQEQARIGGQVASIEVKFYFGVAF